MSADLRKAFATDRATLWHGDCADIASVIAPESIDAIVTDPPAGISFMGKAWDGDKGGRAGSGTTGLAALAEGLRFVGVEREAEFVDIAAGRLAHVECVAVPEMAQGDAAKAEPSQPSLFDAIGGAR